ncbi:hypothetical protein HPB47_019101 [Ixodes persulcatus]|uniref:Uncharacterized protein n=1 Tax=Ixodes persulcatus TaxID=34615 RepID=A0AC60QJ08_IXOPE|nr:hypothetical protein HPB47_019101 [Ixodes persulcatus]
MALLRTVALLQSKGFSEAPAELSCTDLPQQWRVPRGPHIQGTSIQSVNWRSVREGGLDTPLTSRLYESRISPRSLCQRNAANRSFAEALATLGNCTDFGEALLLVTDRTVKDTKFGPALARSPLSYQQPIIPHGLSVLTNIGQHKSFSYAPPKDCTFFSTSGLWEIPIPFLGNEILEGLCLTPEEARDLERNTRQQSKSPTWRRERKLRLTASHFGTAFRRVEWSEKGLDALTVPKDISKVPAVRHGIVNEPLAARCYEDVLRGLGHQVTVKSCELFVYPETPWLGASLDRVVHDPAEDPPHGIVEIKCPHSLYNKTVEELTHADFCSKVTRPYSLVQRPKTATILDLGVHDHVLAQPGSKVSSVRGGGNARIQVL